MSMARAARLGQTGGNQAAPARRGRRVAPAALVAALFLLTACEQISSVDLSSWFWPQGDSAESATAPSGSGETLSETELVGRTQSLLAELGYKPGPADGVPGPRTSRAVMDYQNDVDMRPDGRIDARLVRWLERSLRERRAARTKTAEKPPVPAKKPAVKTPPAPATIRLSRKALPLYEPGTTYVYSDGRVEKVVSLKGSTVRWSGRDGTKFSSDRNFLLPWSYWRSATERGTSELDKEPDALWPLASDRPVTYAARVVIQNQDDDSGLRELGESWRCRLVGTERVAVMAGTFDTYKMECDRKTAVAAPMLKRVWYYAPKVRHYVRRDDIYQSGGRNRLVELVAIRPDAQDWPPITRAALDRAVQHTLDNRPDGEVEAWSSSGVDTKVAIVPFSRFENANGQPCRTFMLTWAGPDGTRHYPGAACRNNLGAWEIPGLEGGPDNNLAISRNVS